MKKKILTLLLACVLATGTIVGPVGMETVQAEEKATPEGLYYEEMADGTIEIRGAKENVTTITIPEIIDGKNVTSIGDSAFNECESLTSIKIPDSVKRIGERAFRECRNLTSIKIPDSVKRIGEDAFRECRSLTSIELPSTMEEIGCDAFSGCWSLTSIKIPDGINKLSNGIFSGCGLTSVTLPATIKELDREDWHGVFYYCPDLKEINVAEGNEMCSSVDGVLYDKGKTTLLYCPQGKTQVSIPNTVTEIGEFAFQLNNGLTSIELPSSVKHIKDKAFQECSGLTSIELPSSVEDIGDSVFLNCESLTSVKISDGMTYISKGAFTGCYNLSSITIPSSVTGIGAGAFLYCKSLKDVYYGGSQEQWDAITIDWDKVSIGFWNGDNSVLKSATIHCNPNGSGDTPQTPETPQKSDQTITAKDITKTYGAKAFSLNAKAKTTLTYTSKDTKVAKVDKNGKVTIKGCGITNITITAKATDKYNQATKTVKLTVKPKKATLSSVKSTKKQTAKVTWKKDAKASGYIIQCATDSKFKKNKVQVTVSKNKTVSSTVKKLKAGKKYYVRVCAYAKSGKTKVQGDWSKVKTVKVKK